VPFRRHAWSLLVLVILAGWFVLLRPVELGGPASYIIVSGTSMEPTLQSGDLVVTRRRADYPIGSVITYRVSEGTPGGGKLVIHRVIGGNTADGLRTQGDNRDTADEWQPTYDDVVGEQWLTIPGAGSVLTGLLNPAILAGLAGGLTTTLQFYRRPRPGRHRASGPRRAVAGAVR
jgi:signal peptidase I